MKLKAILILTTVYFLLSTSLCGCEAFRKKFVRKPKGKREIKVVIETQEYDPEYSVEETYKRYFLFWRASLGELIDSLNAQDGNRKKRISAAKKIIENLQQMQQLLIAEKQTRLDDFILEQKKIVGQLDRRNLGRGKRLQIEGILKRQERRIQKEFNFRHIQDYLRKK